MMQGNALSGFAPVRGRLLSSILLSIIAAACMWSYVLLIWPESVVGLSDLYPRWYGSRELLLHGRNPYSSEVTRDIELWRGKLAAPGEDESRFAYPLYVSFVLAPTVSLEFCEVNQLMFWLLVVLAAASVMFYLRHLHFSPRLPTLFVILLLSLGSFPVAFAVRLRQLAIVSGFFIALALALISNKRYAWGGVALALATIKPQLTFLLVVWLFLWTLGNWRTRHWLLWSFGLSTATLALASELLVRHWISQFIESSVAYVHYTDGRSILQILLTRPGGQIASFLVIVSVLVLGYRDRRAEADSSRFALCTALVLAVTLVVIPTIAPHGQVLLVPAILVLFQQRESMWNSGKYSRLALVATALLLAWQWVASALVSITAATVGINEARYMWLIPLSPSPVLPIAVAITMLFLARAVPSSDTNARQRREHVAV